MVSPFLPPVAGAGLVTDNLSLNPVVSGVVSAVTKELTVPEGSLALMPPPFKYLIVRVVPAGGANP